MRLLRRTKSLFVIVVMFAATLMCAGPPPQLKIPTPPAPHLECRRTYGYSIDMNFTPDQALLIAISFREWQEGTRRTVCFVPSVGGLRMRRANDPEVERRIAEKGAKSNNVPAEAVVGLADFPDAWILTERLFSERDLYAVIAHEIGHLIGLNHFDPRNEAGEPILTESSLMYPSIYRDPKDSYFIPDRDAMEVDKLEDAREAIVK